MANNWGQMIKEMKRANNAAERANNAAERANNAAERANNAAERANNAAERSARANEETAKSIGQLPPAFQRTVRGISQGIVESEFLAITRISG
jgi:methyl-accepting chemotaxis protein